MRPKNRRKKKKIGDIFKHSDVVVTIITIVIFPAVLKPVTVRAREEGCTAQFPQRGVSKTGSPFPGHPCWGGPWARRLPSSDSSCGSGPSLSREEHARKAIVSPLGYPQIARSGDPERGSALQEGRLRPARGPASASQPHGEAREHGAAGRGPGSRRGAARSFSLPLSPGLRVALRNRHRPRGLRRRWWAANPRRKLLGGAPAGAGPKAVTQWTQQKTGSWVIKPTVFSCVCGRGRGDRSWYTECP